MSSTSSSVSHHGVTQAHYFSLSRAHFPTFKMERLDSLGVIVTDSTVPVHDSNA